MVVVNTPDGLQVRASSAPSNWHRVGTRNTVDGVGHTEGSSRCIWPAGQRASHPAVQVSILQVSEQALRTDLLCWQTSYDTVTLAPVSVKVGNGQRQVN